MPVEISVTYDDPQFFAAMQNPDGFFPILADHVAHTIQTFREIASEYAPESEANAPGRTDREGRPMGYYERGRGWWYPLMTHNTLGLGSELLTVRPHLKVPRTMGAMSLKASGFKGVAGYRLRQTSEQMHDQWIADVSQEGREVIGELSNLASYSGYVQGVEQTALHKERGWQQTTPTVWESDEMQAVVYEDIYAALDEYYNLS